jgi:hypothetical protein
MILFIRFAMQMKKENVNNISSNSKGASIFKKMLEDKRAISAHLQKGGKLSDLKGKFNFVKPLSITGK